MNNNKQYFIMKEIKYQEEAWACAINQISNINKELLDLIRNHEKFYFIGCGSSYNQGKIVSFLYNMLFDKKSECLVSSELFLYPDSYIEKDLRKSLFFLISRTGESTETLEVLDIIKSRKGHSVALTTFPKSKLAKGSEYSIILKESEEKSITATKSATSSLIVLLSIVFIAANKGPIIDGMLQKNRKFFENFNAYANSISSIIEMRDFNKYVFLGSGLFFGVAREADLKVREMSITSTESCQPLEYRHGYKSILDKESMVVIFISDAGFEYEMKAALEFKKIGAKVLIICDTNKKIRNYKNSYDFLIDININLEEILRPVYFQLFSQLIGYYQAVKKNIDPSNPRNLDYCIIL